MNQDLRITIVTTYYPPEHGAAANRIAMMANGFKKRGYDVQLISPMPNYPEGKIKSGYRGRLIVKEIINDIKIWRIMLYPSNSKNGLVRIISMFSYALPVFLFLPFISRRYKNILIQCPPLPVAMFATLISKIMRKRLIVNVSDLWPLSAKEMGVIKEKSSVYKIMDRMASIVYKKSDLVLGQSQEIIDYIKNYYVKKPSFLYRNLQSEVSQKAKGEFNGKVIYAGLIGHAQKLADIVKECEFNSEFHIYGKGGDLENLHNEIKKKNDKKIKYCGSVSPNKLAEILPRFSYSLVPLTTRIFGAVPSKLYDSISRGVPVIFMGGGEGANLVRDYGLGYCVNPGDFITLKKILITLNQKDYDKHFERCSKFSFERLSFDNQFDKLLNFLNNSNE